MERTPVQSSNLLEIGYDPDTETLEVMFKNGGVYQYYNLPQHMYDQLMEAQSHGVFFNNEIKGHYPEARM
ncbi:MAG: KTSC domain-containing protein [Henriciella sp.]|nr:KTSC domain-containing protein [Henriciella sp.]MBO6696091.1 KTSC domain-containing protein [Henriciella sp.]